LVQVADRNDADLRIGIIAHGDYCDKETSYVIRFLPLADMIVDGTTGAGAATGEGKGMEKLLDFVNSSGNTRGERGNPHKCYELALSKASRGMAWREGTYRMLVMVGDGIPHDPGYVCEETNYENRIDWRVQLQHIARHGIPVYAVQTRAKTQAEREGTGRVRGRGRNDAEREAQENIDAFWQALAIDSGGVLVGLEDLEGAATWLATREGLDAPPY